MTASAEGRKAPRTPPCATGCCATQQLAWRDRARGFCSDASAAASTIRSFFEFGGGRLNYHLAQINVGRLVAPIDDPQVAEFVAGLEPINALADRAPGFVWRLQSALGNATDIAYMIRS
jgi:hypothetical protein